MEGGMRAGHQGFGCMPAHSAPDEITPLQQAIDVHLTRRPDHDGSADVPGARKVASGGHAPDEPKVTEGSQVMAWFSGSDGPVALAAMRTRRCG